MSYVKLVVLILPLVWDSSHFHYPHWPQVPHLIPVWTDVCSVAT